MVPIATAPALRCGVVPPACRARSASGSAAALPAACRLSQPLRRGAGSVAAHVFTSPLAESSIQPYPDPFPGMQPGEPLAGRGATNGRLHSRVSQTLLLRHPFGSARASPVAPPAPTAGDDLPEDYGHVGPSPPKHRRAGVVLHPTSLPGKYGMGEIGAEAFAFVDWLAATGMQLWQVSRGGCVRGRGMPKSAACKRDRVRGRPRLLPPSPAAAHHPTPPSPPPSIAAAAAGAA